VSCGLGQRGDLRGQVVDDGLLLRVLVRSGRKLRGQRRVVVVHAGVVGGGGRKLRGELRDLRSQLHDLRGELRAVGRTAGERNGLRIELRGQPGDLGIELRDLVGQARIARLGRRAART
jgi:hypothetical protein